MTEWTEATRLRKALDERANSITPADGWQQIVDRVEGSTDSGFADADVVEVSVLDDSSRWGRKYLLAAAAVLLIVGAGAVFLRSGSEAVITDTAETGRDQTFVPSSVAVEQQNRTFIPTDDCFEFSNTKTLYELQADNSTAASFNAQVGLVARVGYETYIVLGSAGLLGSRTVVELEPDRADLVAEVDIGQFGSTEELASFFDAAIVSSCALGSPIVVTTDANGSLGSDTTCVSDQGFQGFVFIDAISAPPEFCQLGRPVYLLSSTPSSSEPILQWVRAQGCEGAISKVDAIGSTITRWRSCDSTLVHVQTLTERAIDASEIDGQTLSDFIKSMARLAD